MPEKQQTHPCRHDEDFRIIHSDISVLKELFGYKDKRNGEFRAEVEKNEDNFTARLGKLEASVGSLNMWLKINAGLMTLFFAVVSALVVQHLL